MPEQGFLAPSINVDKLDPAFEELALITESVNRSPITVLTNNFGFGGPMRPSCFAVACVRCRRRHRPVLYK